MLQIPIRAGSVSARGTGPRNFRRKNADLVKMQGKLAYKKTFECLLAVPNFETFTSTVGYRSLSGGASKIVVRLADLAGGRTVPANRHFSPFAQQL